MPLNFHFFRQERSHPLLQLVLPGLYLFYIAPFHIQGIYSPLYFRHEEELCPKGAPVGTAYAQSSTQWREF
jgi:hypothetical protein